MFSGILLLCFLKFLFAQTEVTNREGRVVISKTKLNEWTTWVDELIYTLSPEDLDENQEKILTLEKLFHHPLTLDQIEAHLSVFFWLSQRDQDFIMMLVREKKWIDLKKKLLEDENLDLIKPFIKFGFFFPPTNTDFKKMTFGISIKNSSLDTLEDFYTILKSYHFKNSFYYLNDSLEMAYLWERDPNEYEVFDLLKWSLKIEFVQGIYFFLGALKGNFAQRLLLSTSYSIRKEVRNPLLSQLTKSSPSVLQSDRTGSEVFLNGAALEVVTNDWKVVLLAGSFGYDQEIKKDKVTNEIGEKIDYAKRVALVDEAHELPLEERLSERVYFFYLEKLFSDSSTSYLSQLGTSLFYGKFSHPVLEDDFYGQTYFGGSVFWNWHPITQSIQDRFSWKFFGELAWLMNEIRQDPFVYSSRSRRYRFHGAFSGGLLFLLRSGELVLHYRELPPGYHAVHNRSFSGRSSHRDERGIYLGYRFLNLPRFKWNLLADGFYPISSPRNYTVELRNLLSYRFPFSYLIEHEIRIKESLKLLSYHVSLKQGFRHRWDDHQLDFSGVIKTVSDSEADYLPSWMVQIQSGLEVKSNFRYHFNCQLNWIYFRGKEIMIDLYHNHFYHQMIYFDRHSLLLFTRQEFFWDRWSTGLSVGVKVSSQNQNQPFYQAIDTRWFFSSYLRFHYE